MAYAGIKLHLVERLASRVPKLKQKEKRAAMHEIVATVTSCLAGPAHDPDGEWNSNCWRHVAHKVCDSVQRRFDPTSRSVPSACGGAPQRPFGAIEWPWLV